jgi:hypothetical protein
VAVTNGYCTVDQLRGQFGDATELLPTELLERAINATSRAINDFTGRRFWQDSEVQQKVYRCDDGYEADVDDISTTTGLIVATDTGGDGTYATSWAASDYQLEPLNAGTDGPAYAWWRIVAVGNNTFPVHARRTTLQVTARFGWSQVPDDGEQACLIRAASIFKRKEATFGVAGFGEFGAVRIGRRDPDVMDLLNNFIKIRVGAV